MPAAIRIYRGLGQVPDDFGPSALTIGNFDGAHIGHRAIFRRVVAVAREHGWKPSALTFDPHPAHIVAPQRAPRLLSAPEERCAWMAEEGIEQAVILPFTPEFSCLSPEEFARDIVAGRLYARAVLVGWNFRFGRDQAGDTEMLAKLGKRYGFLTEVIAGVKVRGRTVSSSGIRRLLAEGRVSLANRMLGRPFAVSGAVAPGRGVGAKQTVPTLNLRTGAEILPARGVYITRTTDLDRPAVWPSVTNVGFRPTFKGENLTVETHVLVPLEGPPPRHLRIEFLRRLRDEKKFAGPAELKAQILRDIERAQTYFRRLQRWVGPCRGQAERAHEKSPGT